VERGDEKIVEHLLTSGANINVTGKDGRTALMLAVERGETEIVQYLLKNSAKINIVTKDGASALDLAVSGGHTEIVKLLKNGANIETITESGSADLNIPCNNVAKIIKCLNDSIPNIQIFPFSLNRTTCDDGHDDAYEWEAVPLLG
jgi:serine/threonine-protein phosphatase 6 regulatory ankyrin repeat subunit B